MIIKGNGFILRHVILKDAEAIFKCLQDKETKKNFMSTPKNIEEVRRDIKSQIKQYNVDKTKRKSDSFVIDINGEIAGEIGIHDIVWGHKAISSSWVAKSFRGKGLGTAVHKLFVRYAFKNYKLKRLQGNVRTFNKASARMLEKSGYKLEGILRKNKLKNGKFRDDMVLAIVR